MRYQGVVLGDNADFLYAMGVNAPDKAISFIENGHYFEGQVWASISWTYDYWSVEETIDVHTFLKRADYDYYALAWEEGMWHTYLINKRLPGVIIDPGGYHKIKIWLPYSYIEEPESEKIRREVLRARNDPKRSNKVFIVNFHS